MVAVDDAEPALFLIDTEIGRVRQEVRLKDVPKAAQIARYAPDNSLLGVTSLNSDTVSLIDPSFREQTAIKVGNQPMDMAFHGDELFVPCQGDGSVHVIDIPNKRHKTSFSAGRGCRVPGVLLRGPNMRVLLQSFALALVAFTGLTRPVLAEDFPSRPITILVPLAPGGGVDFVARTIGQKLSERLGKPVLIENRPGGGTVVAAVALAKAPPDGYTLLLTPGATLSSNTAVYKSLPYDPRTDFVPIALPSQVAFTLVINPSLPIKSIPELIRYAKGKPGELIVGTAGIATTTHLAGELLAFKTGIQLRYAHYRGSPPAMNDVIAGSIQMMFADPVTGAELAKAGKVRALGVTWQKPRQRVPRRTADRGQRAGLRGDQLAHDPRARPYAGGRSWKSFPPKSGRSSRCLRSGSRSKRSGSNRWTARRPRSCGSFSTRTSRLGPISSSRSGWPVRCNG